MKQVNNHIYKLEFREEEGKDGKVKEIYFVDKITINKKDLKSGIEITWQAKDTEFEIWFPRKRNPLSIFPLCKGFSIRSRGKKITRKLRRKLTDEELHNGIFYYTIYCDRTKNMAEGGSSPRMIIR